MFDKIDTTHLTGDIAVDTQFIKDNLTANDAEFFRRAMAKIMSDGTDRINSLTNEELDNL
jgi:hypothetical protein